MRSVPNPSHSQCAVQPLHAVLSQSSHRLHRLTRPSADVLLPTDNITNIPFSANWFQNGVVSKTACHFCTKYTLKY
jgi:ABC-type nitrate/sulfonate/bicarbonate transport system permease component